MTSRKTPQECTPQERAAAMAYIETGSMTQAFKRAYPKSKLKGGALNASAKKVFRRPQVKALIEELQAGHQKRHEVTVDRIVAEYAKLGFANMLDYMTVDKEGMAFVDLSKLTRDQAAAIQEVTVETVLSSDPSAVAAGEGDAEPADGEGKKKVAVLKTRFKLADKRAALTDLGKHFGMFKDTVEHTGLNGGPIQHQDIPRETGKDHLEGLAKRFSAGLQAIPGGKADRA